MCYSFFKPHVREQQMKLHKYFDDEPRGAKQELAARLGITPTWMGLLISGRRQCSAELAKRIEKATKGKVTRKDLRPDLFA
jgi:DNA-binding transcriptional regulator YdaS (Cro superfamily)